VAGSVAVPVQRNDFEVVLRDGDVEFHLSVPGRPDEAPAELDEVSVKPGETLVGSVAFDVLNDVGLQVAYAPVLLHMTHTKTRQKFANFAEDPRLALSIADPDDGYRSLEVRGVVASVEGGNHGGSWCHPGFAGPRTCIRSPCGPNSARISTLLPPAASIAWAVRVSNSAASPRVRTRSCVPTRRRRRPEST
jgi:hypothetical protein